MGIEIELAALFVLSVVASSVFDKFEVETPAIRKLLRWLLAAAITLGSYPFIGHLSLALLGGFAAIGGVAHWTWCWMNNIHPLTAQPRRRYYELRGWHWPVA